MLQNCKKERNLKPTNPQKTHTHTTTHNILVGCSQEWLLGSLRKGGENNPPPAHPRAPQKRPTIENRWRWRRRRRRSSAVLFSFEGHVLVRDLWHNPFQPQSYLSFALGGCGSGMTLLSPPSSSLSSWCGFSSSCLWIKARSWCLWFWNWSVQ